MSILDDLAKLPPGVLTAIAAASAAVGAVVAALLTVLLGKLFVGARDKQDREVEWRKHAVELTKLELERKLNSGRDFQKNPLRPCILDFLAHYRDLQELGKRSPLELYLKIQADRINKPPVPAPSTPLDLKGQQGGPLGEDC
jgi:hypothetical protein